VPTLEEDEQAGYDPERTIAAEERKKMDRFIEFALVAAEEALAQAGWQPTADSRQPTADSRQPTADSRQPTGEAQRQRTATIPELSGKGPIPVSPLHRPRAGCHPVSVAGGGNPR